MKAVPQNYGNGNKFEPSSTLHLNKNHDRIKQQAYGNSCDRYIHISM